MVKRLLSPPGRTPVVDRWSERMVPGTATDRPRWSSHQVALRAETLRTCLRFVFGRSSVLARSPGGDERECSSGPRRGRRRLGGADGPAAPTGHEIPAGSQAPTGRTISAQGNALGPDTKSAKSPEGAAQGGTQGVDVSPLQGLGVSGGGGSWGVAPGWHGAPRWGSGTVERDEGC